MTGGASVAGDSDGDGPSAGPEITSLFTDAQVLAPDSRIMFTAIVSHPHGLTEIVGGTLQDPVTGATYGAFTQSAGGTFIIELGWYAVNAVSPISVARNGMLTFEAVFRDNSGAEGRDTVGLGMSCEGQDACAGTCIDWFSDQANCGGCGLTCDGQFSTCLGGSCQVTAWSPCFRPYDMSCAQACSELQQTCVEGGCGGATYAYYWNVEACVQGPPNDYKSIPCGQLYHDGVGFIDTDGAVRCCCA